MLDPETHISTLEQELETKGFAIENGRLYIKEQLTIASHKDNFDHKIATFAQNGIKVYLNSEVAHFSLNGKNYWSYQIFDESRSAVLTPGEL